MSSSAVSRRVSEFVGVALFALVLVWLIALITFDASDAVWFFNTGGQMPPANFVGQVGAFLAEISFQIFGFASYLVPLLLVVLGWHCFWCRAIDAAYTKLVGLLLLFGCTASFLSLAFGTLAASGKTYRAGGYLGEWLAGTLAVYLNRTGSLIVILTLLFLSAILSTQFSFGRLFASSGIHVRRWSAKTISTARQSWARRQRERQRQSVIRKHLERTGSSTARAEVLAKSRSSAPSPLRRPGRGTRKRTPIEADDPKLDMAPRESPQLPLPDLAVRPPIERRNGSFTLPPAALLDSPKAAQKFDERLLMEDAKLLEEKVPGVCGRWLRRADSSWTGGHDLRVQAGCRRQIQQSDGSGGRPLSRHAGRIGADRAHPRQVDRRHPDSESTSRRDLVATAARV